MSDTSGPSLHTLFATYDPASSSWRTSQGTFRWDLTSSPLTLPAWGMTRNGALYALPQLAPVTVEPECSSSLPTPRTSDANGTGAHGEGGLDLRTTVALLPTPTARDHKDGAGTTWHPEKVKLPHTIGALLPTPRAQNGEERNSKVWLRKEGPQILENALAHVPGVLSPQPSSATSEPSDDEPPTLWTTLDD